MRRLKDGLGKEMLAGVAAITGSPQANGYITFSQRFDTTPYPVIATLQDGASALSLANVNTGSFQVTAVTDPTYSGTVTWVAFGSGVF